MPRQNRVTPYGAIVAYPEHGTFMGNRGILHDKNGQMTSKQWTTHAWIICLLDFKGRHRVVMSPGTYTELFFFDEATALAAGHRPCGECRRTDYTHFKHCWQIGNQQPEASIKDIDRVLHAERVNRQRQKITYQANIDTLPDGVFINMEDRPYLIWQGTLKRWSPGGYDAVLPKPTNLPVTVLTPQSTVGAITAGYTPSIGPNFSSIS